MKTPTLSVTYTTTTPESAANGEPSDTGFALDPEPVTPAAIDAYLEDGIGGFMAEVLPGDLYDALKHSCQPSGNSSFYQVDEQPDYATGETTTYTAHLNGDWPENLRERVGTWLTLK